MTLPGGLVVAFSPLGATEVEPGGPGSATFASFGSLDVSCPGACSAANLGATGLNLFITITQILPTGGVGPLVAGVFSGSIAIGTSTAEVTWATPHDVVIGNYSYRVQNNPLALVPPTSNAGVTSIQARIEELGVPEPSTYLLFSAGLLAIGFRRRYSK